MLGIKLTTMHVDMFIIMVLHGLVLSV